MRRQILDQFQVEIPKNLHDRLEKGLDSNIESKKFKKLTKTTLNSKYGGHKRNDYGNKPMVASRQLLNGLAVIKKRSKDVLIIAPANKEAAKKVSYNQDAWSQRVTKKQRKHLPGYKNIHISDSKKKFNNPQRNVYGVTDKELTEIINQTVDNILRNL